MSDQLNIAYLRETSNKISEIRFPLTIDAASGDPLNKEILAWVKSADTLAVLKERIQNSIIELSKNDTNNTDNMLELPEHIDVEFLKADDKPFRNEILLQDFNKIQEQKYLNVLGQKFGILFNAPLIRVLRLPTAIYANFSVELCDFKTFNLHRETSKFIWSKSLDQEIWTKVGEGFEYIVDVSDVGHYLKLCCVPYSKFKVKGPIAETVSENKVELIAEFPQCPFEDRHIFTKINCNGNIVRVVSYNILADRYTDSDRYPYCATKAMGIHYRKQLIMKELEGYNADIICLQEVDDVHYKSYFQGELNNLGFKSFFNRKGNCIPEGLVLAFRVSRFRLKQIKHLVFKDAVEWKLFKPALDLLNQNEEVKNLFLKQNTSLQTVVLQMNKSNKLFVIGNTHLYYHPDANHIRLLQAYIAISYLFHLRNQIMREYSTNNVAIIFCGDFNSDFAKSLYGFMIRGTIDPQHDDCLKISPSGEFNLFHKLRLTSACGTPKYTNYTDDFKACLDYIFIDSTKLSVKQVVPVPTEQDLEQYVGLPNEFYPSDHVSLVADIEFQRV